MYLWFLFHYYVDFRRSHRHLLVLDAVGVPSNYLQLCRLYGLYFVEKLGQFIHFYSLDVIAIAATCDELGVVFCIQFSPDVVHWGPPVTGCVFSIAVCLLQFVAVGCRSFSREVEFSALHTQGW